MISSCQAKIVEYPKAQAGITWLTISKADQISNNEGKLFLVDVYTEWCGWCKVMDEKTFTDPKIIMFLDENYHSIKFDAESRANIQFENNSYNWIKKGRNGTNELAIEWLGNELTYPAYVFLNKDKKPIGVSRGFMPPEEFLKDLKQFVNR